MVHALEEGSHLQVSIGKKNLQMTLEPKFLEDDFDTYTGQMRKPHVWGGEPELLMSSHVLQMPITVVMEDKKSKNLKVIAEYGQEYGKDNPIRVIYHGYGHYDAFNNSSNTTYSQK
ncbi:OVARIAN TUMOR DOMAIN-containing deubiquitinating enzyme 4-like isoform X1 [Arachis hypogaea]|uniref:Ubiquitin thioesterase OTU n=1 Tax=Arachis hypogaea TaxID=3818 RepID=A0A445DXM1_ARAHY|nr:OTU domain-containing protein At3g57810-like [Arachis hypogaea]QHO57115.1 OTU domain-containing protein [Arachis hypogaea]RYR67948.1 hypothetical protein Ahy_A03g014422 [Arachis hypogaea]